MTDSNRLRVSLVQESSFGVTPGSPAMLVLPTTGASVRDRLGYQQSQTIRNDRNVQDLVRLSKSAGGGLPAEARYSPLTEALGQAIRAVLCTTETAATTQVTGVSATSGVLTAASIETGIEVGDIVRVLTSADVLVAYAKVTVVGSGSITVQDTSITGLSNLKVKRGARMKNGTTQYTYSLELAHLDAPLYTVFTGNAFDTMDYSIADEAISQMGFGLVGASSTRGTSEISGATYTDPTSYPVLDSIKVPEIQMGGATYAAKAVGIQFANGIAARTQIGSLGAQSLRWGTFGATGRITAYHDSWSDFNNFADNVETDMWFVQLDASNRGWSCSMPQVKFSDASADVRGLNQDTMKELAFTAFLDPVELCTVRWQRWDGT